MTATVLQSLRDSIDEGVIVGGDATISGIARDSRAVEPGDLFVALPGEHHRGEEFVASAVERGAAAVMARAPVDSGVPTWVVDDPLALLGVAAEVVYEHPTRSLRVWGVTGTNGKTTVTHLLASALRAVGRRPAQIGTGALRFESRELDSPFTTPFGDTISRFARECVDAGATDLVMEVSSHALAQHRADGVSFDVAGFTNLTQDHLDYHESLEAYGEAKAKLAIELSPKTAVNVDDAFGAKLAKRLGSRAVRVSRGHGEAEVRATSVRFHREGIAAELQSPLGALTIESPLVGAHNLENLLVAIGMGIACGEGRSFVDALSSAGAASGRLEPVEHPGGVRIVVDYAHTPDALRVAIEALRPFTPGRLIVLFGCGGDRDRGKRPTMGEIAARAADVVVITSDNPRSEDPASILASIEEGVRAGGAAPLASIDRGYVVIEDRAEAIGRAIDLAREGDTVLLAGKGHETVQVVGETRIPFDDREVAREHVRRSAQS
jgi:UDP-N-acetylmuramoyl-L-alanyl-D-glutamate--2,6-diaminopimelate ligase